MFRFIQKYVVKEDVPLPKMLAVFGVMIVRSLMEGSGAVFD